MRVKTIVRGILLMLCMGQGSVIADYANWYQWDWRSDFVANGELTTPVNPAKDAEGSSGVWRYAYNTSGAASASIRNTGRMNLSLTTDNTNSLIWSYGTHKIAATYATESYVLAPSATVSGVAKISQLVWTAPTAVTIRAFGTVSHSSIVGNGTKWYLDVRQNGSYSQLDSGAVYNSSESIEQTITLSAGDEIIFSVDANGGDAGDATRFDVVYQQVPEGIVDITAPPYSADLTGVADCTAILTNALAASDEIYLPSGTYRLDGTVTIPAGKKIRGPSLYTTTIKVRNGTAFRPGNNTVIKGLTFLKDGSVTCADGVIRISGSSDVKVSYCRFDIVWLEGRGVVALAGTTRLEVSNCLSAQDRMMGLVRAWGLVDSKIINNTVYGWRPILIHGMQNCEISGNTLGGKDDENPAITGICCTSKMTDNTPAENCVVSNLISGNTIQHISEEGISLDCVGATEGRTQHPTKPIVHFYEKQSSTRITVDEVDGNWSSSGWPVDWANGGYYLVVLTGDEMGRYTRITDSGGGTIRGWIDVESGGAWIDNLSTNDIFQITTGFFDNTIKENIVLNTGRTGITLHGACWNNVISSNQVEKSGSGAGCWFGVWGNIQIASVTCGSLKIRKTQTWPFLGSTSWNIIRSIPTQHQHIRMTGPPCRSLR